MGHAPADIAAMVFSPAPLEDGVDYALDRRMIAVLVEFDGRRTVADIARRLDMDLTEVRHAAAKLRNLGLIETAADRTGNRQRTAIDRLTEQLARAIGPVAVVLVEEELLGFGYARTDFPGDRLPALVDRLAANIRNIDRRNEFRAAAAALIAR